MTAPMTAGEFDEIFRRVQDFMRRVEQGVEKLFTWCNKAMDILSGFQVEFIKLGLQKVSEHLSKFFEEIGKFLTQWGSPWDLWSAGDQWADKVAGPVSALAGQFTLGQLRTDDEWKGAAADAYKNTLPDQKAALEGVKKAANEINTALKALAVGVAAFWAGLAMAIGAFVAELISEACAAATVVGAPPAAGAAGLSTGKVVALVSAIVAALSAYAGIIVTQVTNLQNELHNNSAFAAGAWPRSTTESTNGDWQPK